MPARRLVVAVASALLLISALSTAPAGAAKKDDDVPREPKQKAERTTTTERRRTTTTENNDRRRTTTTRPERASSTTAPARERDQERSANAAPTTTTATVQEQVTTTASTASGTTTTAPAKPGKRYIVVLKKGGDRASKVADDHTQKRKVKLQSVYGHALRGYAAEIADDEIDAVKKDKRVAYVERVKNFTSFAQTLPWGVETVSRNGDDWSSTRPGDGSGAVAGNVYVLDTGIAAQPDLNGGTVFNARGGPNTDCFGHGTHMAGIVGAIDNAQGVVGVAPGIHVNGVKSLDCSGRGTDANAIAGLDWIVRNGVAGSIITMSFGGPISRAFDDAVRNAVSAGFTIITAAGNEHRNACKLSPAHMGSLEGVITVGATTKKDKKAGFSNSGPCVDVYAPGVSIVSLALNGGLATGTGTSASAPHVAGVAALIKAGNGSLAPAAVEAAVKANAVRKGNLLHASSAAF